ncbi:hypothetical protein L226DRAFT_576896 [Lentinus tigrinus ALCF2SS1-7]|uniref:Uncharacterized protein n=1 Tax=Lentinus tigrinus ALCF2SS1-6 TaxID=1328759 RepID=A0A5C2RPL7_9APHY|nr:hypothetical protein L227DRAFT_617861 [Lentinus tigrinus ALCF2SS1-6]RPD67860.1 hypothetical protein L226DRAFT_576896 [Lentinus tigrinus ALCF2SS1-7]
MPQNFPAAPLVVPLADCVFSNSGVASIIAHLRQNPDFAALPEYKLCGAAFGLLTAGADGDGNHGSPYQRFHRLYKDLNKAGEAKWRDGLRDIFMQAVMDHLTILERASGGATLFIHSPGTRPPNTDAVPQEAKLDVCLPSTLITERPEVGIACARMIQYFAEQVAVPAMERWDLASNTAGWPANYTPQRVSPYRARNQPVMPRLNKPQGMFYGRVPGELEPLIVAYAADNLITIPPLLGGAPPPASSASTELAAPLPMPTQPKSERAVTPSLRARGDSRYVQEMSPQAPDESDGETHSVSPKVRGKQRAQDKNPTDLTDLILALQARINKLKAINSSQELEIVGLQSLLKSTLGGSRQAGPDDAGSYTTGRVRTRPASRANSTASNSAISSVSMLSVSSASTTPRRARQSVLEFPDRRPTAPPLGTLTLCALENAGYTPITLNVIEDVVERFPEDQWENQVHIRIYNCSAELAHRLVMCYKKDRLNSETT